MLRKSTLITAALISFAMPFQARAQTMDIVMKIQTILQQLSEIRSDMKQMLSSANIQQMSQNMFGSGDWKEKLKNLAGSVLDKAAERGGTKQAFLPLPDGLAETADDPKGAVSWMEKNFYLQKDDPTREERDEMSRKHVEFKYTTLMSAFGKAVALRKELDKTLESIEQLKQDAESTESELDLQNEINKLAMLKLEQTQQQQLIEATKAQIKGAYQITPVDKKMSKALSGADGG